MASSVFDCVDSQERVVQGMTAGRGIRIGRRRPTGRAHRRITQVLVVCVVLLLYAIVVTRGRPLDWTSW